MNLGVVIQARMGSTRLPGKVMRPIAGRPLLAHVLDRLKGLRTPSTHIVATSTLPQDDVIEGFCRERGAKVFRGSETNVLERYVRCAERFGIHDVVRLTADNPFVDIPALDELIGLHTREKNDLTHSFGTLPIGVGAEVISLPALVVSLANATAPHHFEHVDEFILEHPELFRIGALQLDDSRNRPQVRLTVDNEEDWLRACVIAESAPGADVTTEEAIRLCSQSA